MVCELWHIVRKHELRRAAPVVQPKHHAPGLLEQAEGWAGRMFHDLATLVRHLCENPAQDEWQQEGWQQER